MFFVCFFLKSRTPVTLILILYTHINNNYLPYISINGLLTGWGQLAARFNRVTTGLRILTDLLWQIHGHGVTPDKFRVGAAVMEGLIWFWLGCTPYAGSVFLSRKSRKITENKTIDKNTHMIPSKLCGINNLFKFWASTLYRFTYPAFIFIDSPELLVWYINV